jgi:hypothetical protein
MLSRSRPWPGPRVHPQFCAAASAAKGFPPRQTLLAYVT